MTTPLNKSDGLPLKHTASAFVQTMYFDMDFNYIRGSVEQVVIVDPPVNWESESCRAIPFVRYEYTRVSKKNPETIRSGQQRINQALEKVKFLASVAKDQRSVLKIVRDTIVTKLQPDKNIVSQIQVYCLEESYGSLSADGIASGRKTREMPPHLKEMGKATSKKTGPKTTRRRTGKR